MMPLDYSRASFGGSIATIGCTGLIVRVPVAIGPAVRGNAAVSAGRSVPRIAVGCGAALIGCIANGLGCLIPGATGIGVAAIHLCGVAVSVDVVRVAAAVIAGIKAAAAIAVCPSRNRCRRKNGRNRDVFFHVVLP